MELIFFLLWMGLVLWVIERTLEGHRRWLEHRFSPHPPASWGWIEDFQQHVPDSEHTFLTPQEEEEWRKIQDELEKK